MQNQPGFTGAEPEAALCAIFPFDITETPGDMAFGAKENRAEWNVDAADALDHFAIKAARLRAGRDAAVNAVDATEDTDIRLDPEGFAAVRCGGFRAWHLLGSCGNRKHCECDCGQEG